MRARLALDGEWGFALGAAGDDRSGPLPASRFDLGIRVPFAPQWPLSGLRLRRADVGWYVRSFDVPPGAGPLLLHFGAVDYRARVWVDGALVAEHEGGHTPFQAEIGEVVRGGRATVVVRADDPLEDVEVPRGKQFWAERPEGIFYTATTGIWQSVWLERLPERSLSGVRVAPLAELGAIEVAADGPGRAEVAVRLEGREVARGRPGRIPLSEVKLWSPERPVLYEVEVRLLDASGAVLDSVARRTGLRTVGCRDGRFLLNGEPYVQRLVLDQGYWPEGGLTAPSTLALRRDIEAAQALGFNGARKHQKLEDPRWLDLADELGFLAWVEMPAFHRWSPAAFQRLAREWTEAVERDRDHPSVVAWTPVNESFGLRELPEPERARVLVELYRLTHALDPTRPVSGNDGWEHALTDLCTLHDYAPAAELAARYATLERALGGGRPAPAYLPGFGRREEPLIVSEFGGLALRGSGGWGWSEVGDPAKLIREYSAMVSALLQAGPVEGFCYTQLTDVEQERNGLLTADRRFKVDPGALREATRQRKNPGARS
jgi:beta-galactosidase/beta-glucuronidase